MDGTLIMDALMKCKGKITRGARKGQPCRKDAVTGRDFCKAHLKNRPIGPAHPNYVHGKRSRYLPARIAAIYEEVISDPELTEYRHNIAILQLRQDELLSSGESHLLWDRARTAFDDLMDAIKRQDEAEMKAGMRVLEDLLRRGRDDSLRWREWYEVTERHGRMVEREHKRLAQIQAYISMEQVLAMMGMIANAAAQTISDKDSLKRFTAAIDHIWMSRGTSH
jgi:hypothetical protein